MLPLTAVLYLLSSAYQCDVGLPLSISNVPILPPCQVSDGRCHITYDGSPAVVGHALRAVGCVVTTHVESHGMEALAEHKDDGQRKQEFREGWKKGVRESMNAQSLNAVIVYSIVECSRCTATSINQGRD